MNPYLQDEDFTLYVGDVREVLQGLPDGSVDCVITSPPYWGLRDYGTGSWVGGNPDCDHVNSPGAATGNKGAVTTTPMRDVCGKCGATRQDQQLGLEPTPDQYVTNMVAVFREVRRVLADHGTLWCNMGDSYGSGTTADRNPTSTEGPDVPSSWSNRSQPQRNGLKPKDLAGVPWRLAFALQADGWYLRSDIIWAKPNPMPESVTDRPTKAHEYVFLLSKRPRYWFDAEAVREPANDWGERNRSATKYASPTDGSAPDSWLTNGDRAATGRNVRSVWEIPTQPYPEAHFATYPEELVRRCLLAGCPLEVCRVCGLPRERIVEHGAVTSTGGSKTGARAANLDVVSVNGQTPDNAYNTGEFVAREKLTVGWSDCGCRQWVCPVHGDLANGLQACDRCERGCEQVNRFRPGVVLDPFLGSGTTATVARKHGRHTIGIELNPAYAELAAQRTRQLSLLA